MVVRKAATARKMQPKMSIRTGDEVLVIAGKDRGKRGRVERVIPKANRVVVENVNMVKRHLRRQPGSLQAGIIDKPAPIHRSNLMLLCPNCSKPVRVGRTELPDGKHVRQCKNCAEIIDREH